MGDPRPTRQSSSLSSRDSIVVLLPWRVWSCTEPPAATLGKPKNPILNVAHRASSWLAIASANTPVSARDRRRRSSCATFCVPARYAKNATL